MTKTTRKYMPNKSRAIAYYKPDHWIEYSKDSIADALVEAKSSIKSLKGMPYQRAWVDELQEMEFKREVAGTSRIEGADFTEKEFEEALSESVEDLLTRSQRQARAAKNTYRWIATIPDDRPIDAELIQEIHRRMVTGCDDDHCEPGRKRGDDENVTYGVPRHRGVSGGEECEEAFAEFVKALQTNYQDHDPLVRALSAHYHVAAMHPFLDGNGRTARALEALLLQRAGLKDICFIAMSNYYYEEKPMYLKTLSAVRAAHHDLTELLVFGLRGVHQQSTKLLREIQLAVSKAVFRNTMFDLFNRLKSKKKRVLAERQIEILKYLLEHRKTEMDDLLHNLDRNYASLKNPASAFVRDMGGLLALRAIEYTRDENSNFFFDVRLEWPTEITESEFMETIKNLPIAKTHNFLNH